MNAVLAKPIPYVLVYWRNDFDLAQMLLRRFSWFYRRDCATIRRDRPDLTIAASQHQTISARPLRRSAPAMAC
jgi:hypothetical protein